MKEYDEDTEEQMFLEDKGRELLMTAFEFESYDMIIYLLEFGLDAKRVWGSDEKVFIFLRNYYLAEGYSLEFVN